VLINGQLSEAPVATQTIKRLFGKPVITDHIMQFFLMVSQSVTFFLAGKRFKSIMLGVILAKPRIMTS
jgi:hypothetical protein